MIDTYYLGLLSVVFDARRASSEALIKSIWLPQTRQCWQ